MAVRLHDCVRSLPPELSAAAFGGDGLIVPAEQLLYPAGIFSSIGIIVAHLTARLKMNYHEILRGLSCHEMVFADITNQKPSW